MRDSKPEVICVLRVVLVTVTSYEESQFILRSREAEIQDMGEEDLRSISRHARCTACDGTSNAAGARCYLCCDGCGDAADGGGDVAAGGCYVADEGVELGGGEGGCEEEGEGEEVETHG